MMIAKIEELMRQVAEVGTELERAVTSAQLNNHRCQQLYIGLSKLKCSLMIPEETVDVPEGTTE